MNRNLAFLCFFLSGFAGLVYEIAWIRHASLVFGSTTWALSTVLAVFFGGLAVGSWFFGRLGQRLERPIRLYALLEIGLAGLALLSPLAFRLIDGIYGGAYRSAVRVVTDADGLTWLTAGGGLLWARVALVALVLLPPTILMGGTLPLFCRQFVVARDRIAGNIGLLYGLNTLGAMVGTATAGFILLPRIGVWGAIVTAAVINVAIGLTALRLRFPSVSETLAAARTGPQDEAVAETEAGPAARTRYLVPALFFLTGLVAVGAEVLWVRFLALLVRNSIYTYTITLTVVLAGIVIGSLAVALGKDRRRVLGLSPDAVFGTLQLLAALSLVGLMFLPVEIWRGLGDGWLPFMLLMMPAAAFSGAIFPLANRLVLDDPRLSSAAVGRMAALNTAGGIVGSLVVGFVLLPQLGLATGVRVLALLGALGGATALVALGHGAGRLWRGGLAVAGLVLCFLLPGLTGVQLPLDHMRDAGLIVDYDEAHGATLAAVEIDGDVKLHIDKLWQGSNNKTHQIVAAHLPALLHGSPRQVLVIGVGVGQTAGRFLMHDVEGLDCVDIVPEVFPFIERNFDSAWIHDSRVTLVPDDGRTFVAHTDRFYDLISIELGQVFRPGVDAFYTQEFYRQAAERLAPDGQVAQFVPLGFFQEAEFLGVIKTFLSVFPHASLWYNTKELLLVGSQSRQPSLDLAGFEQMPPDNPVIRDLAWSPWGGPDHYLNQAGALLGCFLMGSAQMEDLSRNGAVYHDDRPELAYATSNVQELEYRERPLSRFVMKNVESVDAGSVGPVTPYTKRLAEQMRYLNLRNIIAVGYLVTAVEQERAGDLRGALRALQQVLELNPYSYHGLVNMGKALLMASQPEQAIAPFEKALAMRANTPLIERDLGGAYLLAGRADDAVVILRKAVMALPNDFTTRNYLGAALAGSGRYAEAIVEFERALALRPGDQGAGNNLNRARRDLREQRGR